MTIVINLPNPALKQRYRGVKTSMKTYAMNAKYERMIRKSQKKIGPYVH
jgi:hypothetical protein